MVFFEFLIDAFLDYMKYQFFNCDHFVWLIAVRISISYFKEEF